jgi:hypothetical protein
MMPALLMRMCQRAVPGRRERRHGGLVGQVQPGHEHLLVTGGLGDLGGGALARFDVADRQRHFGARPGQRPGGLDADARGAAGHDGPAAGEIDAVHDLGGRRFGPERRGDARAYRHDVPWAGR